LLFLGSLLVGGFQFRAVCLFFAAESTDDSSSSSSSSRSRNRGAKTTILRSS
jgi:hypothetical protein